MRVFIILIIISLLFIGCNDGEKIELNDQKAKVSYSLGFQVGTSYKDMGVELDAKTVTSGIMDALTGAESKLSEEEVRTVLQEFHKQLTQKKNSKMKIVGTKNQEEGVVFLTENKKKDGVVTLPDGLQYKIIKAGTGKQPIATDKVTVHYRGTLIDGTEFDSSYKRGTPATFGVNRVIKGWTEALQLMKEGAKWELYIPSELAYGPRGAGAQIGPNAVLIFEVELISIN